MVRKSERRRRAEVRAWKIALHEAGHCIASHFLRGGADCIIVDQDKRSLGGGIGGSCVPVSGWRASVNAASPLDLEGLGKLLDDGVGIMAGLGAELLFNVYGNCEDEQSDILQHVLVQTNEDADFCGSDVDRHFQLSLRLQEVFSREGMKRRELGAFRKTVRGKDLSVISLDDAVAFLAPHRKSIREIAAVLAGKFSQSRDGYGVMLPEEIAPILGAPPDTMIGLVEASRRLKTSPEKVLSMEGVVMFAGVVRVPLSLCTPTI